MNLADAEKVLQPYSSKKISEVYQNPDIQQAIFTMMPGFEYPNWDYRRVGEFMRYCTRSRADTSPAGMFLRQSKFAEHLDAAMGIVVNEDSSLPLLQTAIEKVGISSVLHAVADVCWGKGDNRTDPNSENWTSVAARLDNMAEDISELLPQPKYVPPEYMKEPTAEVPGATPAVAPKPAETESDW